MGSAHAGDAAFFYYSVSGDEIDFGTVDQLFSLMFEICRYAVAVDGLYLPYSPIGLVGQQYEASR